MMMMINVKNDNVPRFHHLTFLLGFIEMFCATVKWVMDIMDANGLFYGIQNRNNTIIGLSPGMPHTTLNLEITVRVI